MKQTAVEWLFEQLCSEKLSWNKDSNGKLFFDKITSDILQQAKAMEKEQIKDAWDNGWHEHMNPPSTYITSVDYYNETFKSE